jgi:hypothetical protein
MDPLSTPTRPNRRGKSTYRPRIVKARKTTGLDNPAGDTCASGYAIRADRVVWSHSSVSQARPFEGGIVQNVPSEARVTDMGIPEKGGSRLSDYFADNTGRPNRLGNQSQDNCMLSRRSQHVIPSSNGLVCIQGANHERIQNQKTS